MWKSEAVAIVSDEPNITLIETDSSGSSVVSEEQKNKIVQDLKDNYNLIGMTSQEVRELLGEPYDEKVKGQVGFEEYSTHDDRTDMIFYYRLREDIISGWEIYLIRFKNNVVFETETGVEDW